MINLTSASQMRRRLRNAALPLLAAASLPAAPPPDVSAFAQAHCTDCHDAEVKKGGLDLTALEWKLDERKNFEIWERVFDRVSRGEMPPEKKPRPSPEAAAKFAATLKEPLRSHNAGLQASGGRAALRRLNRVEYELTVQTLLGIDKPLRQLLPEDTPLHGFDTVGEGLRFSQLQIEKYLEAADAALDAALILTKRPDALKRRISFKEHESVRKHLDTPDGAQQDKNDPNSKHRMLFRELPDGVAFFSTPDYIVGLKQVRLPADGNYRIRLRGSAYQSGGRPVTLMVYSNDYREKRLLAYFDLPADKPREVEFTARLQENEHLIINADEIGFDKNGKGIWNVGAREFTGVGVAMEWIEVEGPLRDSWPPRSAGLVLGDVPLVELGKNRMKWRDGRQVAYDPAPADAKTAAAQTVKSFAARAFRRPLEDGEADRFVNLAHEALDGGADFAEAVRLGLRSILTAPQFLLFEERPGDLDGFSLATRLSYFLWSRPPDAELLKLAADQSLTQPNVLRAQVERLLQDEKSGAFVENFTGQWLELRNISATMPDAKLYPEFDQLLQLSMVAETEKFFSELLRHNLSVANFIESDFVVVNRRLAEHYEIPEVVGEEFRRVPVPEGNPRGGVLTQASILKVTANGTVSSPVLRGAWVMKRLLGQPPQPPPPSVGSIEPDTRGATTIREQLAKHRSNDSCASCHRTMDPPGFALENFDVIGGWRTHYRSQEKGAPVQRKVKGQNVWQYKEGLPVDASGELADGRKFAGIIDFKKLLLDQQDQVLRCVAEKIAVYATGAGIQFADRDVITDLVGRVKAEGGGLRTLVHAVVESPLFRRK